VSLKRVTQESEAAGAAVQAADVQLRQQ
jgi:hypothetical protein